MEHLSWNNKAHKTCIENDPLIQHAEFLQHGFFLTKNAFLKENHVCLFWLYCAGICMIGLQTSVEVKMRHPLSGAELLREKNCFQTNWCEQKSTELLLQYREFHKTKNLRRKKYLCNRALLFAGMCETVQLQSNFCISLRLGLEDMMICSSQLKHALSTVSITCRHEYMCSFSGKCKQCNMLWSKLFMGICARLHPQIVTNGYSAQCKDSLQRPFQKGDQHPRVAVAFGHLYKGFERKCHDKLGTLFKVWFERSHHTSFEKISG